MFSSALKSFSSNITSNYTISSTPSATAGAWKVFDGTKKSTGKAVSIFVFDRKSLEPHAGGLRSRSNGASRRKVHDQVVERLKKEAGALARLRHPNILELAEPVEDTRNGGLMFATEQITATLAGLLQGQDDSGGRGRSRSYQDQEATRIERQTIEIDELEIQKGLLQVAKGLEFLHESAGLVHGNLTPEAIFVNQKSDWKISGLSFSGPPDSSSTATNGHPIALSELLYNDPRLPRTVQLNLDYTSPDFVMDSTISSAADMFSLGLVMISLYNSPHESPLHTNGNISTYKKLFTSSTTVPSASNNFLSSKPVPREVLSNVLPKLITRKAANRMTARQFQESRFFDNILVSAIRFLDSLPTKSANEKSQFLRGLPRVLEQFPKSVLEKKLLPALLEETKDKELLALILGNIFKIVTILSSAERAVSDKVLPKLRELFPLATAKTSADRDTGKDAALGIILENIDLLAKNCSSKDFKDCKSQISPSTLRKLTWSRCHSDCTQRFRFINTWCN
jgi:SCY1-like protein 2